jgi:hypothetical protein
LDPVQTFLTPEGNIETWVDFTIKSATLTQQQEEQMEIDGKEYPLNKCQRHLESNLRKFEIERTKKWMSRIDQTEIGQVITEMDVENVAHLMIMADIDICRCEER